MTSAQTVRTRDDARVQPLGYLLAGLSAAAGIIHIAMVPIHAGGKLVDPLGFAVAGVFQLVVAALLLTRRADRPVLYTAIVGNLALVGAWAVSRTAGLPWGEHASQAEAATSIDIICVALEAAAIALAVFMVLAPERLRFPEMTAVVAGCGAVAVAMMVIASPQAAEHGGHTHGTTSAVGAGGAASLAATGSSAGGHDHGGSGTDASSMAAEMLTVDQARCDFGFNPVSYWQESARLGIDTYGGGAMDMSGMTGSSTLTGVVRSSPLGGRGSPQLDKLVSLTSKATSELAAGMLVAELGNATDAEYEAWKSWLVSTGQVGGSHAHSASGDDTNGHGGHVGPHPWKAMVDLDQCDRLADELEQSRDVALKYPTAADATAAGWTRVTPYVPGIAAHYMKFPYVDGTFEIDKPEMLLYDGSGPEAHVVGLSYYVVLEGSAEPTQGFTGDSDHFHRHIGLCVGAGGVIGDSTTTEEECAARGGKKQSGDAGWMNHVWTVPGCESPWGVFSGANPILDGELARQSGKNDGGCKGSGVLDRYDLSAGGPSESLTGSKNLASGKR